MDVGQLDAAANRVAHYLVGLGAGPERVVAVAVERSAELVAALLGVVKAGAAFLPVDPGYPAARIAFMLADARPAVVVCTAATVGALPGGDGMPRVVLDDPGVAAAVAGCRITRPLAGGGGRRCAGAPGVCDLHLGVDRDAEGCGGHSWRDREPGGVPDRPVWHWPGRAGAAVRVAEF